MRVRKTVYLLASLLLSAFSFNAQAQYAGTSSPYSRYGIGDLQTNEFVRNAALGGSSIAVRDDSFPGYINFANPASYSAFRFTILETGVKANFENRQNNQTSENRTNVAMSYFSFGFPIKKLRSGLSFGLRHYSHIGYKINDTLDLENVGTVNYQYLGDGGTNQFYLGLGGRVLDNDSLGKLSFGINASYLFGRLDNIRRVEPDTLNALDLRLTNTTNMADFFFNYGMQYDLKLKKNMMIGIGAVYSASTKIKGSRTILAERYRITPTTSGNYESVQDTAEYIKSQPGNVTIPQAWGLGFSIQKLEKWMFTADYSSQNWSDYQAFGETDNLADSWRASVGFEFSPDKHSDRKGEFFKRVAYRFGGYYSNTYLQLHGSQLNDYGITFGFGLPIGRSKVAGTLTQSIANIAVELGQRGTLDNDLIKENYINLRIGFTLNDNWFNQRKYD